MAAADLSTTVMEPKSVFGPSNALILHQVYLLLEQKKAILHKISQEDYVKPIEFFNNASVGSHIRHSMDHVQVALKAMDAFITGSPSSVSTEVFNYDIRNRDSLVSVDKAFSISLIDNLHNDLRTKEQFIINSMTTDSSFPQHGHFNVGFYGIKPVVVDNVDQHHTEVETEIKHEGQNEKVVETNKQQQEQLTEEYVIVSSLARELSFVAHHGIHHLFVVKLMMKTLGYRTEEFENIGVAPSTIQFTHSKK